MFSTAQYIRSCHLLTHCHELIESASQCPNVLKALCRVNLEFRYFFNNWSDPKTPLVALFWRIFSVVIFVIFTDNQQFLSRQKIRDGWVGAPLADHICKVVFNGVPYTINHVFICRKQLYVRISEEDRLKERN